MLVSEEIKEAIVNKVFSQEGQSLKAIARQNNIPSSTLNGWVTKAKLKALSSQPVSQGLAGEVSAASLSAAERLEHLLASARLSEVELGAYCRERGLYSFQLNQWKKEFMVQDKEKTKAQENTELKALRVEVKRLRSELNRKDKALAEASALLILKKKRMSSGGIPRTITRPRRAETSIRLDRGGLPRRRTTR